MAERKRIERILMTADALGGVWTYALDLARGLVPHGVEVVLATMGGPLTLEQRTQAASVPNVRLFESSYRLEWMPDPWRDVESASDWLLTLENDTSPDIVHLNGYSHGNLPWRAPHLVVGHSCVLSWWRAVKGQAAPGEWTRYRVAVASGLRRADVVVAPTRAMMSELQRLYGPLRSTGVIANGRCGKWYRPAQKEPFILAAGRVWDEAKNISMLSRVRSTVEWPICVAGDHRHPNGQFAHLNNIRLLGVLRVDELALCYGRASIYCLPARYEPFGLSVVEAALSGCALVLGDIPSLRENWEGAAAFVPPDDPEALERTLADLIAHPQELGRLGMRARSRARRFRIGKTVRSYLALYSQLASRQAPITVRGE
jgi:glycosyltransferase involved in cell wall biosynthesis